MSSEKSNPKIAVMMFPGTNCENESKYSLASVGMDCEIVRWNEPIDKIKSFDGYLIAGGWSYEDRIRAGIIAAKSNIMATLKEMDALGKPIIGICNGCQVLMESGLVPDLGIENVEMALAPNKNPKVSGFYCTWTNLNFILCIYCWFCGRRGCTDASCTWRRKIHNRRPKDN